MGGREAILVIGPGAIGAFLAARLAAAGHPVTVACRTARTADEIGARGVVAEDHAGGRTVGEVRPVVTPEEALVAPDLVLLSTKCTDAAQALANWIPHLPKTATVVGLQNGIMTDTLAPLAPIRYVDAVVHFPASLAAAGHSVQTGPGGIDVGLWPSERPTGTSAHVEAAARILAAAVPTRITDNIDGAKWTKLIVNSCITSLGALSGQGLGDLLRDHRARSAFIHITTEGEAVGRAHGVTFETVQRFHPARFAAPPGTARIKMLMLHQLLRVVGRRYRRHRSSSLQSLERGGRTEVDFLNGMIVRTGQAHGVGTPVNRAVIDVVHDVESGHASPSSDLLDRLPLS